MPCSRICKILKYTSVNVLVVLVLAHYKSDNKNNKNFDTVSKATACSSFLLVL